MQGWHHGPPQGGVEAVLIRCCPAFTVLIKTTINWESSLCNFVWSRPGAKRFISPLMIIIKSVFSINLYIYIYIYIKRD
jgi:hypothetical protein